jgi:hypothetical protein
MLLEKTVMLCIPRTEFRYMGRQALKGSKLVSPQIALFEPSVDLVFKPEAARVLCAMP